MVKTHILKPHAIVTTKPLTSVPLRAQEISYDEDCDALYVKLRVGEIVKTVSHGKSLNIDLDEDGNVVGYELLNLFVLARTGNRRISGRCTPHLTRK